MDTKPLPPPKKKKKKQGLLFAPEFFPVGLDPPPPLGKGGKNKTDKVASLKLFSLILKSDELSYPVSPEFVKNKPSYIM